MTESWRVEPVLGVADVLSAVDFFCDKLGFTRPEMLYGPPVQPVYAVVRRAGVAVHLQVRRRPLFSSAREDHEGDAYFMVENVDTLRTELLANGVKLHRDIQDEPYGLRDFTIETPEGHRLSFASPL